MDFLNCLGLAEARKLIDEKLTQSEVGEEEVELLAAIGRVVARTVRVTDDLPGYARSTVDGFAIRSEDSFGAGESTPALFALIGEIAMGAASTEKLLPGQAMTIPTGGVLPDGADAAVMLEYTEQPDADSLLVQKMVAPFENVVRRGEEITAGTVLVEPGVRLSDKQIGLLAACGCSRLWVKQRLKVALLSTGDELVDIHQTPRVGQVRDVNSYSLAALLVRWGCDVSRYGIVRDSLEHFLMQLTRATQECQLVIISGGSSVGARDFTVPAMQALDRPGLLMHGLAIKPGKPTIFGLAGSVPVFGLPGHPMAAWIVCELLVGGAIEKMTGALANIKIRKVPAVLSRNLASLPGRDDFVPVRLVEHGIGYLAEPIFGKSGMIGLLAKADGVLHIPAANSGLYQGDTVWVRLLGGEGE